MNSKAIRKQLFAAVAMVLVAAVALGSSTYAWFASNNTVTANGMSVSAVTEGSQLIIADTIDNLYSGDQANKTSVGLAISGASLHPTHPVYTVTTSDGKTTLTGTVNTTTWNHAYSDQYDTAITKTGSNEQAVTNLKLSTAASGSQGQIGQVVVETGDGDSKTTVTTNYFLKGKIAVGLTANSATNVANLKVDSCGISWATNTATEVQTNMLNSVRVLLTDSTDKVVGIYANGKYVTASGAAQSGVFGTKEFTPAVADTLATIDANSPVIADSITAGQTGAKQFNVYIYFDGRDSSCTSELFSTGTLQVALSFSATPA